MVERVEEEGGGDVEGGESNREEERGKVRHRKSYAGEKTLEGFLKI